MLLTTSSILCSSWLTRLTKDSLILQGFSLFKLSMTSSRYPLIRISLFWWMVAKQDWKLAIISVRNPVFSSRYTSISLLMFSRAILQATSASLFIEKILTSFSICAAASSPEPTMVARRGFSSLGASIGQWMMYNSIRTAYMTLIVLGKDEDEWKALKKALLMGKTNLEKIEPVAKLAKHLESLDAYAINFLFTEVLIPVFQHYLGYRNEEFSSVNREKMDSLLRNFLRGLLDFEGTKPSKRVEDLMKEILSPNQEYYNNKSEEKSLVRTLQTVIAMPCEQDTTIPQASDLFPTSVAAPKEEFWISVSSDEEEGDPARRTKALKQYHPIMIDLSETFIDKAYLTTKHPPHSLVAYGKILESLRYSKIVGKGFIQQLYTNFRKVLLEKFRSLAEEELKEEESLISLTSSHVMFGLSTKDERRYAMGLCNEYQLKLLSSMSVQNRLKGCNYLSQFCEEVYFENRDTDDINKYANIFVSEKIVDRIFTLGVNEQILQKADKFFQFMVRTGNLSTDNLRQVLNVAFKGSPFERRFVLEMLDRILMRFSQEQVSLITSLVHTTPLSEMTLEMIKLLFHAGKYFAQKNLIHTKEYFWAILTDQARLREIKPELLGATIDNYVQLIEKGLEILKFELKVVLEELTSSFTHPEPFQILSKLVRSLPEGIESEKFKKLGCTKREALRYLVEEIGYQDTLLEIVNRIKVGTDDYISFLITMIEGYRPFTTQHLGVEILSHLTNNPAMFQTILPLYTAQLQTLFVLLINSSISTVTHFQCTKEVFLSMNNPLKQNPSDLNGYAEIFQIILKSPNPNVKKEAAIFCAQLLYSHLRELSPEARLQHQCNTLQQIITNINSKGDNNQTLGWLIYLEELLNETEMEGVGILKGHGNLVPTKLVELMVTNETYSYSYGSRDSLIKINSNSSLYELIEKVAIQFKTTPEEIKLTIDYSCINPRYNGKTIQELHLLASPVIAQPRLENKIQKVPLLTITSEGTRILTSQATNVFSEVFYRHANAGFIGRSELSKLLKAASNEEYDYNISEIFERHDLDQDNKLNYQEFMSWIVESCKFRENQVRKFLEGLKYRPDLNRFGDKKADHTQMARYYLFNNTEIYPILIHLIDSEDKELQQLSKILLIRLPTYKGAVKWLDQLHSSNKFMLWYQLLLVEFLLEEHSSEEISKLICDTFNVEEWRERFKQREYSQLLVLIESLLSGDPTETGSECVLLSLKILSKLSQIPSLTSPQETIDPIKLLQIPSDQLYKIAERVVSLLTSNPQLMEVYLSLLLHSPILSELPSSIININSDTRSLVSNYIYFHRKIYGRKTELLKDSQHLLDSPQFCQLVVREIEESLDTYQHSFDIVKSLLERASEHSTTGLLRILDRLTVASPELIRPDIQQMLLSLFQSANKSQILPIYNILVRTDQLRLVEFLLEYISPLSPAQPPRENKNAQGFVGMRNLGCICYMNAMLQQLYMTKDFVSEFMSYKYPKEMQDKTKQQKSIIYQLQRMFSCLQHSSRLDYNPLDFCHSFDSNIKLNIQQDTEEFVNKLFDRLESDSPSSTITDLIEKHFGGKTISTRTCSCGVTVSTEEKFFHLTLEVRDCHTLQSSLNKLMAPEVISDVFCEGCQTKSEISRSTKLSELPQTLIIHLQRMTFDLETLARIKLHDCLEFPKELDLQPYLYRQAPCHYSLKGVIIHSGNADAGHYYSLVKLDRWFKFDDSMVTEFSGDFNKECFGGNYEYGDFDHKSSKNAYILIYERVTEKEVRKVDDSEMRDMVLRDNDLFSRESRFYSRDFTHFLTSIISSHYIPSAVLHNINIKSTCYEGILPPKTQLMIQNVLQLIRRFLHLSKQLEKETSEMLCQCVCSLLYLSPESAENWLLTLDIPSLVEKLVESSSEPLRKVYKVMGIRLCVMNIDKHQQKVEELLKHLLESATSKTAKITKMVELTEMFLGIAIEKQDMTRLIGGSGMLETLIKLLVNGKAERENTHKLLRVRVVVLDVLILAVQQHHKGTITIKQQTLNTLTDTDFYQQLLEEEPLLVNRLSLLAMQLMEDMRFFGAIVPVFMSKPPSTYIHALHNLLSLNNPTQHSRIQYTLGLPQRIPVHSSPYSFAFNPSLNLNSPVVRYISYDQSRYKSLVNYLCQTSNHPNSETSICIEALLTLMINIKEVFLYVMSLPPPNYKYGLVTDLLCDYLHKMRQAGDKRLSTISSLYQRVLEDVQQLRKKMGEDEEGDQDGGIEFSPFPFPVLGRTAALRQSTLDKIEVGLGTKDEVVIDSKVVVAYEFQSKPTGEGNLSLPLHILRNPKSTLYQRMIDNEDMPPFEEEECLEEPVESLVVLAVNSQRPFKLMLNNDLINIQLLISERETFINLPFALSLGLSVGISSLRNTIYSPENTENKPEAREEVKTLDTLPYDSEIENIVDGVLCKTCTFLNSFNSEKCEMCESEL